MAISRADSYSRVPVVGMVIGLATVGSNLIKGTYDVACLAKNAMYKGYLQFRMKRLRNYVTVQTEVAKKLRADSAKFIAPCPKKAALDSQAAKLEASIRKVNSLLPDFGKAIYKEEDKLLNNLLNLSNHAFYTVRGFKRCVPGFGTKLWKLSN
jgi:hypothetical protein